MNNTTASAALNGWSVLVTRPRAQADALCTMIEQQAGRALRFPVIEIQPLLSTQTPPAIFTHLGRVDIMIFISRNAVLNVLGLLPSPRPPGLQVAAIGKATAQALEASAWQADLLPALPYNSEALLALPPFQAVADKRIVIIKGEGGRSLLLEVLRQRGAEVECVDVYRRSLPQEIDEQALQQWLAADRKMLLLTSEQSLCNLETLMGSAHTVLAQTPTVVISERLRDIVQAHGSQAGLEVAQQASDEAMLEAMLKLAAQESGLG